MIDLKIKVVRNKFYQIQIQINKELPKAIDNHINSLVDSAMNAAPKDTTALAWSHYAVSARENGYAEAKQNASAAYLQRYDDPIPFFEDDTTTSKPLRGFVVVGAGYGGEVHDIGTGGQGPRPWLANAASRSFDDFSQRIHDAVMLGASNAARV